MQKALAFIIIIFAALFFLRTPDTNPAEMRAKYASDASRFATSGAGLSVHYRDQGNPDGAPLILVHGSGASLHTWEPLVDLLGNDYRIITYTQPGHGLTGPHPDDNYAFAGMAEALDLIVAELDLQRFALIGSSMGGWLSWRYALAHPERVDALVLIAAAGAPAPEDAEDAPLAIGFRILKTPAGRFLAEHFAPRSIVEKSALQSVSVKSVMDEAAVDRYWELLRYPGNRRAAGLRSVADREPHYGERLRDIETPTLIIWGDEDRFVPVALARAFAKRLPNAQTVIYEGVGHLPMEEAPNRTAQDIAAFLQKISPLTDEIAASAE